MLYKRSVEIYEAMVDLPQHTYTEEWGLPFTAVSVISNRASIIHRDTKSLHSAYDLLVTVGRYEDTHINFHDLGIIAKYSPGSMVLLTGRVLRHGVPAEPTGRLCLAYYFREAMFRQLNIEDPGFMNQRHYHEYMTYFDTITK